MLEYVAQMRPPRAVVARERLTAKLFGCEDGYERYALRQELTAVPDHRSRSSEVLGDLRDGG